MRTRFLVQARYCSVIDSRLLSAAGATLVHVGRLEDDGTVTVEVDSSSEIATGRRLADVFAPLAAIERRN
jgi:hypothetical protein